MYSENEFWHDVHESDSRYDRGSIDKKTHDEQIRQYLEWIEKSKPDLARKVRRARGL